MTEINCNCIKMDDCGLFLTRLQAKNLQKSASDQGLENVTNKEEKVRETRKEESSQSPSKGTRRKDKNVLRNATRRRNCSWYQAKDQSAHQRQGTTLPASKRKDTYESRNNPIQGRDQLLLQRTSDVSQCSMSHSQLHSKMQESDFAQCAARSLEANITWVTKF